MSEGKKKVMMQPINAIFRLLQNKARVQVWLYENVNSRIEGVIIGFDEYMNLVRSEEEGSFVLVCMNKTFSILER